MENNIGIVEGFFGPAWPEADRKSYAEFLELHGGGFYIYAPKQDPLLRKSWREDWGDAYIAKLQSLCDHFHSHHIQFGVGLSPFGLGKVLSPEDKQYLKKKLKILNDIGIDLIGLFFDDMPTDEDLAQTQLQALNMIQRSFDKKIVFCPTYYSYDPILEKVFGKKPEGYLEELATHISAEVAIAWTGPKVISPTIDKSHLVEVSTLLKRKPFIWENLFANDGPKNCKFLKLKPFEGRDQLGFQEMEAIAFNMMNQPHLSKIVFLASKFVLDGEYHADLAFENALIKLCSMDLKDFIMNHRDEFLTLGLDEISQDHKSIYIDSLRSFHEPIAQEILKWLEGEYIVGSECLTD